MASMIVQISVRSFEVAPFPSPPKTPLPYARFASACLAKCREVVRDEGMYISFHGRSVLGFWSGTNAPFLLSLSKSIFNSFFEKKAKKYSFFQKKLASEIFQKTDALAWMACYIEKMQGALDVFFALNVLCCKVSCIFFLTWRNSGHMMD